VRRYGDGAAGRVERTRQPKRPQTTVLAPVQNVCKRSLGILDPEPGSHRLSKRMPMPLTRIAAVFVLLAFALGAAPAFASSEPHGADATVTRLQEGEPEESASDETDIVPVAVWTIAGVLLAGLAGGVFYLLKRRVGGFPQNPSWVAPISIMESKDFADEGSFGDAPVESHH